MPKVLMATSLCYTSLLQVGSHHYARAFEKLGYEVGYVSVPISPFHRFAKNTPDLQEKRRIHKTDGETLGNIWHYVPNTYIFPKHFFPFSLKFVFDYWYKFTSPDLMKHIQKNGFGEVDVLWFDSPLYAFLLDKISYDKSILRLADYSGGFNSLSPFHLSTETKMIDRVDEIIFSAKNLPEKYHVSPTKKMRYVPNGVDLSYLQALDTELPKEYQSLPEGPRIVYIGAIDEWFDIDLVVTAAKKYPAYNFILIGPSKINTQKLNASNIFLLGVQDYKKIGMFLKNADLGIIPFKQTDLVHSIHPLKLYEYLAFGIPCLSMRWDEIENIPFAENLADTPEQFIDMLPSILGQSNRSTSDLSGVSWENKLSEILRIGEE